MKTRNRLKWTLVANERPKKPGHYFFGCMYYPDIPNQRTYVTDIVSVFIDKPGDVAYPKVAEECVVWYGPVDAPSLPTNTLARLKREQGKAFSRLNKKVCNACGAESGVNSRSMAFVDSTDDCRKCGAQGSVVIVEKNQTSKEQ